MRLFEAFAERGFHSTFITTFAIDFDAIESIVVPRLRGSGCNNIALMVDQGMLSQALASGANTPAFAGRHYSVSGTHAKGVFHSKIILQIGRNKGRLLIGSANMTASGLAGNKELVAKLESNVEESSEQQIIAACWDYLKRVMPTDNQALKQQVAWMEARSAWLLKSPVASSSLPLDDGSDIAFLAPKASEGIFTQLRGFIDDEPVTRIAILSPYWDKELAAVQQLVSAFQPSEVVLLIDKDKALFPNVDVMTLGPVKLKDISEWSKGRFVHAKLIILSTETQDHVLFGSANCTIAAMGTDTFPGTNQEACIYRSFEAGFITDELELSDQIETGASLSLQDLPEYKPTNEAASEQTGLTFPGTFECLFDDLIWRKPDLGDLQLISIALYDEHDAELDFDYVITLDKADRDYRIPLKALVKRPALARLRFDDGTLSAPAVVNLVDALRSECRERLSKSSERTMAQLADETEEGLWLLEILDQLESVEQGDKAATTGLRRGGNDTGKSDPQKTLSYEAFVAGARLREQGSGIGRNSLSGSELSIVRSFLNRLLNMEERQDQAGEEDATQFKEAFNLDEELGQNEQLEASDESPSENQYTSDLSEEQRKRSYTKRKHGQKQIVQTVLRYIERIKALTSADKLSTAEALRFRALATVIAASAWAGSEVELRQENQADSRTSIQVLPAEGGQQSWPRLLGRLMFAMFGGKNPGIRLLHIDPIYDQVPDDIVECWAVCFWLIHACGQRDSGGTMRRLAERMYALTAIVNRDREDARIAQIFEQMTQRFGERLGVDGGRIVDSHNELLLRKDEE
ncbi:hypothetical protein N9F33_01585 [Pseudomonadales bacterium]|nr:hypothetical protein [Pseudomonadales bacterium]